MNITNAVPSENCHWCGQNHSTKCPLVKAYEYHENGTLKKVEFYTPGDAYPGIPVYAYHMPRVGADYNPHSPNISYTTGSWGDNPSGI